MSTSTSPCAACKFLRRKCTQECVFAPYFPPDQPQKFANVHKVFGASNVGKILNELNTDERADAVNSLAYEAEARLRDPVYGCVGTISILQHRWNQIQTALRAAKQELTAYIGPSAMMPMSNLHPEFVNMQPYIPDITSNLQPMICVRGHGTSRDAQHQHQLYEAQQQQLVGATREQELLKSFQQPQQPPPPQQLANLLRLNGTDGPSGQVNPIGFTQLTSPRAISPSLALAGSYDSNMYQHQQEQHHHHPQQVLQQQRFQPQQQSRLPPHHGESSREGGARSVGPLG